MAYAPPRPNTPKARRPYVPCDLRQRGYAACTCPTCSGRRVERRDADEAMRSAKVTRFSQSRPS